MSKCKHYYCRFCGKEVDINPYGHIFDRKSGQIVLKGYTCNHHSGFSKADNYRVDLKGNIKEIK